MERARRSLQEVVRRVARKQASLCDEQPGKSEKIEEQPRGCVPFDVTAARRSAACRGYVELAGPNCESLPEFGKAGRGVSRCKLIPMQGPTARVCETIRPL